MPSLRSKKRRANTLISILLIADLLVSGYYAESDTLMGSGAAFGLKVSNLLFLRIIFIAVLILLFKRGRFGFLRGFSLAFVIFGALANTAKMVFFGGVPDYLCFFICFNISDVLVTSGALVFLTDSFLEYRKDRNK